MTVLPLRRAVACAAAALAAVVAGCSTLPQPARSVQIQRTAHGIAHIEAPDYESLAYGVAYAHAQDNVCQTANQLVTVRGERSRYFGPQGEALLGLRVLPNEQIDIFVRSHMDDAALAAALATASADTRAAYRGYIEGYNRYLRDHAAHLPAPCHGMAWVRPMTPADYLRLQELTMVQLGVALFADAIVAAAAPDGTGPVASQPAVSQAVAALERFHLSEPLLGSNGWAFGADVTRNGRGVLLGNPHFPWSGVNRFWQMHLTIPGKLDVMGAAIGHTAAVQIGFNRDVAWTHTVSTGQRFTLYELELAPGDPHSYLLDGKPVPMTPRRVTYEAIDAGGAVQSRQHTVWQTRFGPVLVVPRAGLGWSATRAYALKDANTLNVRAMDIWLGFNRDHSVGDMRATLARLGVPWVNTIAADRDGNAMYADVSVVPDIDAAQLARCAPSKAAAALFKAADLTVLDGSRSSCDWHRDPSSPVPGWMPIERMPVAVRRDWVQNSNDSFWMSNPGIGWPDISPLVGWTAYPQSLRTRSGLHEIERRLAGEDGFAADSKVGIAEIQSMLFANRNHAAWLVLDDFLPLCRAATSQAGREGCAVLAAWDRRNNLGSRGEHLFREWWRIAGGIEGVWRTPFDPADPVNTPAGLDTGKQAVRTALLEALDKAVATVRAAGFTLDAPLGDVQTYTTAHGVVGLHGGPEFEGVLNKVETAERGPLESGGYQIDFGSSYIQTVTFDDRGPVAEAMMVYGQSSQPDSPYSFDQLPLYTGKRWMRLPFYADDVARERVGDVLRLTIE
ncbi:MAG: penicillin acylase family protein [Steroidobacteraceae bacterium]